MNSRDKALRSSVSLQCQLLQPLMDRELWLVVIAKVFIALAYSYLWWVLFREDGTTFRDYLVYTVMFTLITGITYMAVLVLGVFSPKIPPLCLPGTKVSVESLPIFLGLFIGGGVWVEWYGLLQIGMVAFLQSLAMMCIYFLGVVYTLSVKNEEEG